MIYYAVYIEYSKRYDKSVESLQKPTEIYDHFWVHASTPHKYDKAARSRIYGKWLIFRHFDKIDELWGTLRTAVLTNNLCGCVVAKCSTMKYNPSQKGPGPCTTCVIQVYTEEHNMEDVGFELVKIAEQDIKYKLDIHSLAKMYVHTGAGKTTIKTIFWNNGKPSLVNQGRFCFGAPGCHDSWYLNVVKAPKKLVTSEEIIGKWIIQFNNEDLTHFWHVLKEKIESDTEYYGVIKMVCPSKVDHYSAEEKAAFEFYVSEDWKDVVGQKLIKLVSTDISFERKLKYSTAVKSKFHSSKTLYWNNGEPGYVKILKQPRIPK